MTFANRSATIGVMRKGGIFSQYLHFIVIVLNAIFWVFSLCYCYFYWFDPGFFSVVKENVPAVTSNVWGVLIFSFFAAIYFACWDLTSMGNLFGVFSGHEGWIIGMTVDVFFDMIDKMEDETESRKYVILGFIIIGLVISFIGINFVSDQTGLTGGTIIAVAKVHNTYFFSKEKKVSRTQWFLVYLLGLTSLVCKLSEGSGRTAAATQTSAAQSTPAPSAPSSPSVSSSHSYYSMPSSGGSTPKKGRGKKGNNSKGAYQA